MIQSVDGICRRPRDRLLRRLDRARCAQGRLPDFRDRGRDARDRPQRIARGVDDGDAEGRRAGDPLERDRGPLRRRTRRWLLRSASR